LGKNHYNKSQENNNNNNTPPSNQQASATYNHGRQQKGHHDGKKIHIADDPQSVKQSSSRQSFSSYAPLPSFALDSYLPERVLHLHD
jgi:hypothetical protein